MMVSQEHSTANGANVTLSAFGVELFPTSSRSTAAGMRLVFSPWAGVWACSWSRSSTGWSRPTGWRLGLSPSWHYPGPSSWPGVSPRRLAGRWTRSPPSGPEAEACAGSQRLPLGRWQRRERWGCGGAWATQGRLPALACGIARRQPVCTRKRADGIATRPAHARRALARMGTSAIMPAHHADGPWRREHG